MDVKFESVNHGEKTASEINEMIKNLKEGEVLSIRFDAADETDAEKELEE